MDIACWTLLFSLIPFLVSKFRQILVKFLDAIHKFQVLVLFFQLRNVLGNLSLLNA
uniref:Candidate secreted effector n=1 Tax=Meloidogyne incognita TaxID=6306 RepID=A0A914MK29_MELIC